VLVGPLWFPMNFLIIESIERMGNFSCEKKVEFPTNSGQYLTYQVRKEVCFETNYKQQKGNCCKFVDSNGEFVSS
jgi:hypothetical protein